ncbi:6-phospho-beta-glucosidase [Nonomuraea sp. NPDC050556]|uniref:6-phospho-beta-glucosidase n=1 Tax=Nonomuraea sp. NPDC050556 TaxID=3364369 RepID=UPI003792E1AB
MKLTVVGGGSTYTPELVDGFARLGFPVAELALVDPDISRLEVIGGLSSRILQRYGHPGQVRTYQDLDAGIEGASAVLLQLRVGGQAARHVDETLPLSCGCVGQETTGAGGLAKALRTVPVVLDIADRVERLAPKAWIVDFTNPVGIVTRALLDAGHRAVGLCNVAIGLQRTFASWLDVAPSRLSLDHVGLNHLTWERAVHLDGVDVLPRLLASHGEALAARVKIPVELLRRLGVVPSYYLRYFYAHDQVVAEQLAEGSRAERVAEIEQELLDLYADPALVTKPALLDERGGAFYSEAAVNLVASLTDDRGDVQVVNIRNQGTLPFLPPEAVIEVPATVGALGAVPVEVAPVSPLYAGLIGHVSAYETLAVDAALRGGISRVEDALLAHPLVGQADVAVRLAGALVAANREYLPWA